MLLLIPVCKVDKSRLFEQIAPIQWYTHHVVPIVWKHVKTLISHWSVHWSAQQDALVRMIRIYMKEDASPPISVRVGMIRWATVLEIITKKWFNLFNYCYSRTYLYTSAAISIRNIYHLLLNTFWTNYGRLFFSKFLITQWKS